MKPFIVTGNRSSGHHNLGKYNYLVFAGDEQEASKIGFAKEREFIRANPSLKLSKKNLPWVKELDTNTVTDLVCEVWG